MDGKVGHELAQWEDVEVTFPATANADCVIRHSLVVGANKDDVRWQVVSIKLASVVTVPLIYRHDSSTARPWGTDYIILRCNVASVKVVLRLSLSSR